MTSPHQSLPATGQAGSAAAQPLFATLPVALGDYTLTHLLGCHEYSDFYIARQNHVERRVVLELLRPGAEACGMPATEFHGLARARVSARLPYAAPVLESATSAEGYAYICQALPEGTPLSAKAAGGQRLTVPQACALIRAAESLYSACAEAGLAAAPLAADMVFMSRSGAFHFLSPVLNAPPAEGEAERQMQALAEAICSVQPANEPGQTRIATLLSWMQEGYEGEALDWSAAAGTAALIAEQLRPDTLLQVSAPRRYDHGREQRAGKRRRRQQKRTVLLIAAAIATILAMGGAGTLLAPDSTPPLPALRGGYVHARAEGKLVQVAASPVSIGEYHSFLKAYPALDAQRRGSLAQNIPPTESDPTPADWEAQLRAAQQGAEWQGRRLSTASPVTNVSYWQALMYARYRRGSLPSATLLAAARAEAGLPGIEEWTQDELPPAPPYAKARTVLPAEPTASPIPEGNPAARTPQRGFRLCP